MMDEYDTHHLDLSKSWGRQNLNQHGISWIFPTAYEIVYLMADPSGVRVRSRN